MFITQILYYTHSNHHRTYIYTPIVYEISGAIHAYNNMP